jgi:hypothetical protein
VTQKIGEKSSKKQKRLKNCGKLRQSLQTAEVVELVARARPAPTVGSVRDLLDLALQTLTHAADAVAAEMLKGTTVLTT